MKMLFLTSEGFDTPNSINHLCEALIEDILKSGIEVHSISSHKTGKYCDIPKQLLKYNNFSYDIIKRKNIDKNNFVKRYIDEIKYALTAKKLWKRNCEEYDVILLQSNPNSVFNALLLSHATKAPIILNLYDVFPGHAMSIGVIKSKFVYNFFRIIQKLLYKKCKYIVAMSDDMKDKLLDEKVPNNKIKVINNWFDDSMFRSIPREENSFFKKYNLDINKFYVQFAGLLGYVFDYEIYLDAAELLKSEKDILFLLIGEGNQKEIILKSLKERNLDNVLYFQWQPLEIIADVYSACDIGIIPLKKGVIGNGIPSKACQLMAARRVILNSSEVSNYTRLFQDNSMGVNVTNYSAKDVAKTILELKADPKRCAVIGENAHEYSFENYSRAKNTAKFIKLINSATNDRG